jgi:LysR family pca operon transcriptional activator
VLNDTRIKFRHLACFLEVAAQRSFVRAAEALAITQPAVSKAIAELEDILGVSLLERSRGGVSLTPYGEAFRRYAGASVTALRQGINTVAQARAKGGYSIAVGALPTVAARIMPAAIQMAKADGLGAGLRIVTGPNDVLLAQLRNGELDLVVGRLSHPQQMQDLAFEHLYSEEIVFVTRPGHPLCSANAVELQRLADYTVLMPTDSSIIRRDVDKLLIAHGVSTLPDVIETVSPSFGRRYARTSDAVWIISYGVVAHDLEDGTLARLKIEAEDMPGPVGLTQRVDTPAGVSTQLLIQAVRKVAQGQGRPPA